MSVFVLLKVADVDTSQLIISQVEEGDLDVQQDGSVSVVASYDDEGRVYYANGSVVS